MKHNIRNSRMQSHLINVCAICTVKLKTNKSARRPDTFKTMYY